MTSKSAKQINAEISSLLTRTGAQPYWPGGDGGGGSGRPRGSRAAVVKPHARTTATCTRCSQYHTTEEHERHAGARSSGLVKRVKRVKVNAKKRTATKGKISQRKVAKKTKAKARKSTAGRSAAIAKKAPRKRAKSSPPVNRPPITIQAAPIRAPGPQDERADVALASLIKSTIPKIGPEGRFGWKVFISEIWRRLRSYDGMSLPEFKARLLRLNRKGLVVLARADLVGAMDPAKVAASEITDRGSSFHFVLDPDATPGY